MQAMIKIKYVGKGDMITCEYNGKRYAFTKKKPVKEIPVEVYDFIKMGGTIFTTDIMPYQEPEKKIEILKPEPKEEPKKEFKPKRKVAKKKKVKK